MSLAITIEQDDLRATVRKYLDAHLPTARVREVMAESAPHDPVVWRALADIGVHGLAVPERFGGSGEDLQTLGLVFEEAGRSLLPGPLLTTLGLAAGVLLASGDDEACARHLPGIVAGMTVATVAFLAPGGGWDELGSSASARRTGDGWVVDGRFAGVLDAMSADVCLVLAGTDDGLSIFAIGTRDAGVTRTPVPALDPTRGLADLELAHVGAELVGSVGSAGETFDRARDRACALLASEMVGGAQECLDQAVSYAKERVQFGRVIGSFQAIKHKCAEVLVEVDGARACARYAAWAAGESVDELPAVSAVAKGAAGDAFFRAAAENLQIHGGIGFTWEHDAHLYLKRAKADQVLFGDGTAFRQRVADRIGL